MHFFLAALKVKSEVDVAFITHQEMCHNVTNAPKDMIFLELRQEVKVTVTQRQYATFRDPRFIHTPNMGSLPKIILEICSGHDFSRIEARGQGHNDPKIVHDTPGCQGVSTHPIRDCRISNNIGDMLRTQIRLRLTNGQLNYMPPKPTLGHKKPTFGT